MGNKAKSILKKVWDAFSSKEVAKDAAVDEYGADKAAGGKRGAAQFAKPLGLSRQTIWRLSKGGKSKAESAKDRRLLTVEQEKLLVDHILEMADRSLPLDKEEICEVAADLVRTSRPDYERVGLSWFQDFMVRNGNQLAMHWTSPLDSARCRALNPAEVKAYFAAVKKLIDEHWIPVENYYGMDESGIQPGVTVKRRVIGRKGAKIQHCRRDGDRENITIAPTICGDGTSIRPMIIFKGQRLQPAWGRENPLEAM